MDQVNEKTCCTVTVAFVDETGAPVTPTGGHYQIDDDVTGTAIVASTSLSFTGSSVDIPVTMAQNALVNTSLAREVHVLTVDYTYGSGKGGKAQYKFEVINLQEVT